MTHAKISQQMYIGIWVYSWVATELPLRIVLLSYCQSYSWINLGLFHDFLPKVIEIIRRVYLNVSQHVTPGYSNRHFPSNCFRKFLKFSSWIVWRTTPMARLTNNRIIWSYPNNATPQSRSEYSWINENSSILHQFGIDNSSCCICHCCCKLAHGNG